VFLVSQVTIKCLRRIEQSFLKHKTSQSDFSVTRIAASQLVNCAQNQSVSEQTRGIMKTNNDKLTISEPQEPWRRELALPDLLKMAIETIQNADPLDLNLRTTSNRSRTSR
jgi:hypothetical protein